MDVYHVYITCILLFFRIYLTKAQGLAAGSGVACDNEGKEVVVPGISDQCITCMCENKEVKCSRKACPSLEGCYAILFDGPAGSCCDVCQGCQYNNRTYASGESWDDPTDKCSTLTCRAGTLTRSRTQCYTPCSNPVFVPGKCCPICRGCEAEGTRYEEGDTFKSKKDNCTDCQCKDGTVTCRKRACPVLDCPMESIYTPEGECCPKCKGMRKVFALPSGLCLFRKRVYGSGKTIRPDQCTKCICQKGTVVCDRETCPVITCPEAEAVQAEGSCCKKCPEKPRMDCASGSKVYQHGERWNTDLCTECRCDDGSLRCRVQECHNALGCPKGYKMKFSPGKCCPECVEADAVCSVFGDPHYRTFDSHVYNFQGTCKYLLAQDCVGKMFAIRVRNSARRSNSFAWTQMITIDVDNRRISLHQYLEVKVDRKSVNLPYKDNRLFAIRLQGHNIVVKLNMGVELTWDGDSFLEVKVSSAFKNRMCGLCGNYNGNSEDDLTGKDGKSYDVAEHFGKTWRVGSSSACERRKPSRKSTSPCSNDFRARLAAHLTCDILRQSVFGECRKKVNVAPYFKSCMTDVCDCPENKKCICEVVHAYSRACARAGVKVNWKHRLPQCDVPTCPKGAVYSTCSSPCTKTCANRNDKTPCLKPCVPGCICPSGKVLHKNKCIRPRRCPRVK